MRRTTIYLISILFLLLLLVFSNSISAYFSKLTKKEILFLEKEVNENNRTALFKLQIYYTKQNNNEMFKKYFFHPLVKYCQENKNKCEE